VSHSRIWPLGPLFLALAVAGCVARPAPVALEAPGETAAPPNDPPSAAVGDEAQTIEEEELPADENLATTPSGADRPLDALSVEPPTLLDTIDASTAPNIAAATHLVEAGRIHMAAGDNGAALEQLERAIAIDPGNPYAYYYLAELHLMHRTYDQAIEFADRAANLSNPRSPMWASRAYTLQGNAFEAAGRFADARDAYARAVQVAPGNLAAQVGLARVGSLPVPQQ
jgi:tetratricopeptide (TPR) repeat protein